MLWKRYWRSNRTDEEHRGSPDWFFAAAQMTYRSQSCDPGRRGKSYGPFSFGTGASQIAPPAQPIFSLATPGQQFGFKLPGTGQVSRGQMESSCGSLDSLLSSSHASTTFTNASRPSTTPTSHVASICPSSQGDPDIHQQPHAYSFSSHLKKLALASQSGIEAPARNSRVSSGMANFPSPGLPIEPSEGQLMLF